MKTALCLSGHVRNLHLNIENLRTCLLGHYKPSVFLHLWDTYGWRAEGNDIELGVGKFKGFDHYSGKVNQQQVLDLLQPVSWVFESFEDREQMFVDEVAKHKPFTGHPKDRPENTVGMAWKIYQCNELRKQQEELSGFEYDLVIRSRPDMVYGCSPITHDTVELVNQGMLLTPEAYSYDHASDIFAMGSSEVMNTYSDLFLHLDEMGGDMNPHSVCKRYFDSRFPGSWQKHPFRLDLNRCRKSCSNQTVCSECDPSKKILSNIL